MQFADATMASANVRRRGWATPTHAGQRPDPAAPGRYQARHASPRRRRVGHRQPAGCPRPTRGCEGQGWLRSPAL